MTSARKPLNASRSDPRKPGAKPKLVPGKVRIIGGQWKRTPITVVDVPGLRPTPDRVRETLFNWIGPSIQSSACLDLFGGTGALGFECASRGAASVVIVEQDLKAVSALEQLKAKLKADQIEIHLADALTYVSHHIPRPSYDLIFLDPPFKQGWPARILPALLPLLKPGGLVYLESEQSWAEFDWARNLPLSVIKQQRAGQVHYHLVKENSNDNRSLPGHL